MAKNPISVKKSHLAIIAIILIALATAIIGRDFIYSKYDDYERSRTGYPGEILPYNGNVVLPLKSYSIVSGYGERSDPFTGNPSFHSGIDLEISEGMAVMAVMDGNIFKTGYQPNGYGNWIEMQHPDGTYTLYAHLSKISNISTGQNVGAGSVIGAVGTTGRSIAPHLHFEWRDKDQKPQDPNNLLDFNKSASNGILEMLGITFISVG